MLEKGGGNPAFFHGDIYSIAKNWGPSACNCCCDTALFLFSVFKSIMNSTQFFASPFRTVGMSLTLALAFTAALATQSPSTPDTTKPASAVITPAASTILARGANGMQVSVQDVYAELQRAPEATRTAIMSRPESLQQVVNNIMVRRTLAAEGERNGVSNDPMVASTLALTRDRILSDARLAQLDSQNTPSKAVLDKNVPEAYKANSTRFDKPALTRASHILLDSKASDSLQKAQELLAKLRAGASFEDLAKNNSIDPGSAVKGGDLGFFPAGKMVQVFDDAVAALTKPGELSEPVLSQFGYHIIRLEERKEKSRQALEEVREQLSKEVTTTIRNEARSQKIQKLSTDFIFDTAAIEALSKTSAP